MLDRMCPHFLDSKGQFFRKRFVPIPYTLEKCAYSGLYFIYSKKRVYRYKSQGEKKAITQVFELRYVYIYVYTWRAYEEVDEHLSPAPPAKRHCSVRGVGAVGHDLPVRRHLPWLCWVAGTHLSSGGFLANEIRQAVRSGVAHSLES